MKDTYNYKGKKNCKNKDYVNSVISKYIIRRKLKGMCVALDTPYFRTKNMLLSSGIKATNIYIPNNNKYSEMKRKHRNMYNGTLGDFLDDKRYILKNRTELMFLDYCCPFFGSVTTKIIPIYDINKIFKYKLIKHNGLLAVQFSTRDMYKQKGISIEEYITRQIMKISLRNGYAIVPLERYSYRGMIFVLYECITNFHNEDKQEDFVSYSRGHTDIVDYYLQGNLNPYF